jgi:hypothetical protein
VVGWIRHALRSSGCATQLSNHFQQSSSIIRKQCIFIAVKMAAGRGPIAGILRILADGMHANDAARSRNPKPPNHLRQQRNLWRADCLKSVSTARFALNWQAFPLAPAFWN